MKKILIIILLLVSTNAFALTTAQKAILRDMTVNLPGTPDQKTAQLNTWSTMTDAQIIPMITAYAQTQYNAAQAQLAASRYQMSFYGAVLPPPTPTGPSGATATATKKN